MSIAKIALVVLLGVIIVFNPKIRLWKVFSDQIKVYRNDQKKRVSFWDICSFLIAPLGLSILVAMSLPYEKVEKSSNMVITVFSIIATILLSFLALLIDKGTNGSKEKEVAQQTFVTITIDIIYSILVVLLFVLPEFIAFACWGEKIFVGIVTFLIVKILLNILMILKRVYAILSNSDTENN